MFTIERKQKNLPHNLFYIIVFIVVSLSFFLSSLFQYANTVYFNADVLWKYCVIAKGKVTSKTIHKSVTMSFLWYVKYDRKV